MVLEAVEWLGTAERVRVGGPVGIAGLVGIAEPIHVGGLAGMAGPADNAAGAAAESGAESWGSFRICVDLADCGFPEAALSRLRIVASLLWAGASMDCDPLRCYL